MVHKIATDFTVADLNTADLTLCKYAQRLTKDPASMSESHILELRRAGFNDAAIHDASQVVSYFNYINRIADSLNVDLEQDVHAWESSTP